MWCILHVVEILIPGVISQKLWKCATVDACCYVDEQDRDSRCCTRWFFWGGLKFPCKPTLYSKYLWYWFKIGLQGYYGLSNEYRRTLLRTLSREYDLNRKQVRELMKQYLGLELPSSKFLVIVVSVVMCECSSV